MSRFRILKELKKSLKRKRRHVWSLGAGLALFLLATLLGSWFADRVVTGISSQVIVPVESEPIWVDNPNVTPDVSSRDNTLHALRGWSGQVELVLHRTYLCGEETRYLGKHSVAEAESLLKAHREWDAVFDSMGKLQMEESIDDLSPQCSKTAYIGIDKDANLILFDGPPKKEKVIRTFFQLDIEMLESRMNEERVRELAKGIRVTDKDEYNSVLSTFNEFESLRSSKTTIQP